MLASGFRRKASFLSGKRTGVALPAILTAALVGWPAAQAATDFETPPILDAEVLAGDIPLEGETYTIADQVPTDGFMATFSISSPYGAFTASGPGMLAVRLDEIRALAALEDVRNDDQFASAAAETAKDTAGGLRTLATRPRETLAGVPEGVGRFFDRTGRSVRTGIQKLDDTRHGRTPGVGEEIASDLPGGSDPSAAAPESGSLPGAIARAGGSVAVNILGFDEQRRRLAKALGVDPYTTNPVLDQELDDVTWAAFAGGLGVNIVTSLIPGGALISATSTMTDWVWDTPPGDLRVEIEQALLSAGASQGEADRLLRHAWYPLSAQAVLASSFQALDGVEGRSGVLPLALGVGSEGQARFAVQSVEMLKRYHLEREPLTEIRAEGVAFGQTESGEVIVPAPVNYLSWTPRLEGFVSRFDAEPEAAHLLTVAGKVSERTRTELEDRGWQVEEDSDLGPILYPVR
ncbi:hypothetical protein [Amaricoccus macauensis]|uniref:hypothetical protein n=1 Tax=Amaricoccus macauensis TaxID=57001 RepID=UPI003C7D5FE2